MNKKIALSSIGTASVAALLVATAVVKADSFRYDEISALGADMQSASAIALAANPGKIVEVELEMEKNRSIWEVEIVDKSKQVVSIALDGITGEILQLKPDDDAAPNMTDVIDLQQAIDIVLSLESGALIEAEFESEDGIPVWELETLTADNKKIEFAIDGVTGDIL